MCAYTPLTPRTAEAFFPLSSYQHACQELELTDRKTKKGGAGPAGKDKQMARPGPSCSASKSRDIQTQSLLSIYSYNA